MFGNRVAATATSHFYDPRSIFQIHLNSVKFVMHNKSYAKGLYIKRKENKNSLHPLLIQNQRGDPIV